MTTVEEQRAFGRECGKALAELNEDLPVMQLPRSVVWRWRAYPMPRIVGPGPVAWAEALTAAWYEEKSKTV